MRRPPPAIFSRRWSDWSTRLTSSAEFKNWPSRTGCLSLWSLMSVYMTYIKDGMWKHYQFISHRKQCVYGWWCVKGNYQRLLCAQEAHRCTLMLDCGVWDAKKTVCALKYWVWRPINPLKTKRRLLYLKTQFVPRSKHFSSRLWKPTSLCCKWHRSLFVLR